MPIQYLPPELAAFLDTYVRVYHNLKVEPESSVSDQLHLQLEAAKIHLNSLWHSYCVFDGPETTEEALSFGRQVADLLYLGAIERQLPPGDIALIVTDLYQTKIKELVFKRVGVEEQMVHLTALDEAIRKQHAQLYRILGFYNALIERLGKIVTHVALVESTKTRSLAETSDVPKPMTEKQPQEAVHISDSTKEILESSRQKRTSASFTTSGHLEAGDETGVNLLYEPNTKHG